MPASSSTVLAFDPLPFGNGSAAVFDRVSDCTAFLDTLPEHPTRFDVVGGGRGFQVRMRSVMLPAITFIAGSSTPKRVDHDSTRAALVIPFGDCASQAYAGTAVHRFAGPDHALFIPAGTAVLAESTAGSFLRLDIDERRLETTAAGMFDAGEPARDAIDTHTVRTVPLRTDGFHWLPQIRAICASLDALLCDADAVFRAGLDDVAVRTVVMMLRPDVLLPSREDGRPGRGLDLDPLLERLLANLGERITLADMESWTGRTARSIQLTFRKRFGIAPMRWLRDRRLDAIHTRLSCVAETASVRQIAGECGIPRVATFVSEYARRFGEKPAETRRRHRH